MARGLKPGTRRLQLLQTLFKKYRMYQQVEGCELSDLLVYTLVAVQCAKKYLREDLLDLPTTYDALDDLQATGGGASNTLASKIAEKLGIEVKGGSMGHKVASASTDLVTDGDKIVEAIIIGLLGEIYFADIKKRDETYVDEKGNVYHFPNLVADAEQHWKRLLEAETERLVEHKHQNEEALAQIEKSVEAIRGEVNVEKTVARMEYREAEIEEFEERLAAEVELGLSLRKQINADNTLFDLISKELDAARIAEAAAAGANHPENAPDSAMLKANPLIPNDHLKYAKYLPFSVVGEESYVPITGDSTAREEPDSFSTLEAKIAFEAKVQAALTKCKEVYFPMFMPCTYIRLFGYSKVETLQEGRVNNEAILDELGVAPYEKENIEALANSMINTRGCTYNYVDDVERMTTDDYERLRQQRKIMRLRSVVSKMKKRWYDGRKSLMRDLRRLKFISAGFDSLQQRATRENFPTEEAEFPGSKVEAPNPLQRADIFGFVPHLDDLIKRVTLATSIAQEVLSGTTLSNTLNHHSYIRQNAPTRPFIDCLQGACIDDLFDDNNAENSVCLALYHQASNGSVVAAGQQSVAPKLTAERLAAVEKAERDRHFATAEFEEDDGSIDNMSLSRASDVMTAPRSPTEAGIKRHTSFSEEANHTHGLLGKTLEKTANFMMTPRGRSMPSARSQNSARLMNSARRASSAGARDPLLSARRLQTVTSVTTGGTEKINTARRRASVDGVTAEESDSLAANHLASESVFSVDGGYAATSISAAALNISHNTASLLDEHHKSCRPKSVTDAALATMVTSNPTCVFPFQEAALIKSSLLNPQRAVGAIVTAALSADTANPTSALSKSKYRGDGNLLDLYAGVVRDYKSQTIMVSGRLNDAVLEQGGDLSGFISDSDDEIEENARYRKKFPLKKGPARSKSASQAVNNGPIGAGWLSGKSRAASQGAAPRRSNVTFTVGVGDTSSKSDGRRPSSFGLVLPSADGAAPSARRSSTAASFDDTSSQTQINMTPEARRIARLQRKKEDAMLCHYYRHHQRLLLRQRVGLLIDPIDATSSFIQGDPRAPMCLVGITVDGAPVAGVANRVFLKDEVRPVSHGFWDRGSTHIAPQSNEVHPPLVEASPSATTASVAIANEHPSRRGIVFVDGEEGAPRTHPASSPPPPPRRPLRPHPREGISLPMRLIDQNDDDATDEDRAQSGKHGTCVTVRVDPSGLLDNPNGALSYSLHYLDGSFVNFLVLNGNLIYADEAALIDGKYTQAFNDLREREIKKFFRRQSGMSQTTASSATTRHNNVTVNTEPAAEESESISLAGTLSATGVNIPSLKLRRNRPNVVISDDDEEDGKDVALSTLKELFDVFGNAADLTMISDGFHELSYNIRRELKRLAAKFEQEGILVTDSSWGGKYDMLLLEKLLLHVAQSNSTKPELLRELTQSIEPYQGVPAAGAGNKVLMVAEGDVDSFFAASNSLKKWDTCAPHAFLRCLGGDIVDREGVPLFYPTPEYATLAVQRAKEQASFSSLVLMAADSNSEAYRRQAASANVQIRVKQAEKRAEFAAFEAFTTAIDDGGDDEEDIEMQPNSKGSSKSSTLVGSLGGSASEQPQREPAGDAGEPTNGAPQTGKPTARFADSVIQADESKQPSATQTQQVDVPVMLSSLRRRRHSAVGGKSEDEAVAYYDPISLPNGAIALRGHFVKTIVLKRLAATDFDTDWDVSGGDSLRQTSRTYDCAGRALTARAPGRAHTLRARIDDAKLRALEEQLAAEKRAEEEAAARQKAQQSKCCCAVS